MTDLDTEIARVQAALEQLPELEVTMGREVYDKHDRLAGIMENDRTAVALVDLMRALPSMLSWSVEAERTIGSLQADLAGLHDELLEARKQIADLKSDQSG